MKTPVACICLLVVVGCGRENPVATQGSVADEDGDPHGSIIVGSMVWNAYPAGTEEFVNGLLSSGRSDFPGLTLKEVISTIHDRNAGIARMAEEKIKAKGVSDLAVVRWVRIRRTKVEAGQTQLEVGMRVDTPAKREYMWFGAGLENDPASARQVFVYD